MKCNTFNWINNFICWSNDIYLNCKQRGLYRGAAVVPLGEQKAFYMKL